MIKQNSLAPLIKKIPKKYMTPHHGLAAFCFLIALFFTLAAMTFAIWVWNEKILWLFPLSWFLSGTAFTSFFVLGHDCGHCSFIRNRKLMIGLGHLFSLPALYPFYAWKFSHHAHHKFANKLLPRNKTINYDNAWMPVTTEEYEKMEERLYIFFDRLARIFPPIGSLFHHLYYHFRLKFYNPRQRKLLIKSYIVVAMGLLLGWIVSFRLTGSPLSILHFWLLPAIVSHAWMSTYTFLHHTSTNTKFFTPQDWTPYKGQVESSVNCFQPRLISFLHFNIDIHIPHHVLLLIPCYYLREVNKILKKSEYGKDMKEVKFSFGYLFFQLKHCKLWNIREEKYVPYPRPIYDMKKTVYGP